MTVPERQTDLEGGLLEVSAALRQAQEQAVVVDGVRKAPGRIGEVYRHLKLYEQRELMGMLLRKAEINEREMVLEIFALGAETLRLTESVNREKKVHERTNWLPGPVSQSVFKDRFLCRLPSLSDRCHREKLGRIAWGTPATVAEWRHWLDTGAVKNRAELARRVGVSRARVTQALNAKRF